MNAGYAQAVITPDLSKPVYLAGFDQNTVAKSVHDDLYVRVLALTTDETRLVLVTVDVIGLNRLHCQEIERRVKAQAGEDVQVVAAASHTHFGPDTIGLWGPDETTRGVDEAYLASLKEKMVQVAVDALRAAGQNVQMRSASVNVTGVAKNARDPHILDEEATCLQFQGENGTIFATLVIYPCHPEVLWRGNTAITADYVDSLRKTIEAETHAPALFMAGALGGMMTPDMGENTHEAAEKMGSIIAVTGLRALESEGFRQVETLRCTREEVVLPMNNLLFEQATQAGLLPELRDEQGCVHSEVGFIQLDDCSLATVPGELFPKLGKALKSEMKAAGARVAGVIGLANDEIGYILPKEEYIYPENPFEPGDHYEETMSLGAETAPILMNTLKSLF